ncbi:Protein S-acyltransferase 8 [Raphanus sativus]|nr:Protein S-acyltransferase 8 [Raphanus sativus]
MEVFCTKVKPSRNNFRAFVEEEQPPRGAVVTLPTTTTTRESAEDENGGRREKVEDDLDIGDDLMNISQRCNPAEGSNHGLDIDQSMLGVAERAATIRTETRHGSWGSGRSGSWDIEADVSNSNVRERPS